MEDLAQAAEQVASLMRTLTSPGGLRLKYRITAGAGAADPDGFERRDIYVECKGPDAGLLVERDGELLRALEHIAAKILRLEPEDHDRISFDAEGFKAARVRQLRQLADAAMDRVDDTGQPYTFPPMSSRERRMLHLFLRDSGLQTASSGEGPRRAVVLYPEGYRIPPEEQRSSSGSRSSDRSGDRHSGSRSRGPGRGGLSRR
ncbi:MAG TPA: R3H domain-containing nucleic acid-binding protein [Acidobacteriaceae bacterium]|jgi:spoIIIJ-associated protein|nr:R3H domain-containing nucleic acid-binding protein [Acidobacteriaceae bacterium]